MTFSLCEYKPRFVPHASTDVTSISRVDPVRKVAYVLKNGAPT